MGVPSAPISRSWPERRPRPADAHPAAAAAAFARDTGSSYHKMNTRQKNRTEEAEELVPRRSAHYGQPFSYRELASAILFLASSSWPPA